MESCWSWCARRLQRAFTAGEPVHVNFPEISAKILQSTSPRQGKPGNSFWVDPENLPGHLAAEAEETATPPEYLDDEIQRPNFPVSSQVSFFSVTSSVVGLSTARTLKARMAAAESSEGSVAGGDWENYYSRANRQLLLTRSSPSKYSYSSQKS